MRKYATNTAAAGRVDWAVEAARRVGGGLGVAALKVLDGLRGGAGRCSEDSDGWVPAASALVLRR